MTDLLDVAAGDDAPRPILLGEAPSKGGDRFHAFPLSGRPAKVLCTLAGIPPQADGTQYGKWTWALYERFECRNLHERYAAATPWSTTSARERATAVLDDIRAELGSPLLLESYDAPLPVIVCLGRKVQAAVLGALRFRYITTRAGAWDTGVFGDFGVWAAPWHIYTPVVRTVCAHCGEPWSAGHMVGPCPAGADHFPGGHVRKEIRERRWAPHVVTIPHPSGLNRLLNDDAHRAACGKVLRRALELAADPATVAP